MKQIAYAAYHKNVNILKKSSSGALFTAFSDYILKHDGVVIGAEYNYLTHELNHVVCRSFEERDRCRGSKYIQSKIPIKVYMEVEKSLNADTPVLYLGMPCQIAAIKSYIWLKQIPQDKLYTCDILCHGVGSPGIWKTYIHYLEMKKAIKIDFITFKDKRNGWKKPICIGRSGRKEFSLRGYSWLYFSDAIMRPACHDCQFTNISRSADITIGDFWKVDKICPDMFNSMGTSFAIVNSEKGKNLFAKVKPELVVRKCRLEDVLQNSMKCPTPESQHRNKVMNDYRKSTACYFFCKWKMILLMDRLKKCFK